MQNQRLVMGNTKKNYIHILPFNLCPLLYHREPSYHGRHISNVCGFSKETCLQRACGLRRSTLLCARSSYILTNSSSIGIARCEQVFFARTDFIGSFLFLVRLLNACCCVSGALEFYIHIRWKELRTGYIERLLRLIYGYRCVLCEHNYNMQSFAKQIKREQKNERNQSSSL